LTKRAGPIVQELEAKYLLAAGMHPDRVLRRLEQSLSWAGFRVQPRGGQRQVDVYFDTADWQLQRSGWSYRRRTTGEKAGLALKALNRARSGVFDREEIEQTLWQAVPDPARPPIGPVQERLRVLLRPSDTVAPLFEIINRRVVFHLSHPDFPRSLIELAFDRAEVQAEEPLAFSELEFELKRGPHELLANLLAITELEGSLVRARLSKYERGLIAAGCQLARRKPPSLNHIGPDTPWIDLAIAHLKGPLYDIKLYEPYAWESVHIEGVHQMRVATRRARAALRTFIDVLPDAEARSLEDDIRWLTAVLGPVRDLDVHLEHLASYRKLLPDTARGTLDRYQQHLLRDRRRVHGRLLDALGSPDYTGLIADYGELLSAAADAGVASRGLRIGDVAFEAVKPLLKKVRRRGRRIDEDSPPEALHRLRIDVKRLRYQLEFLLPAYPELLTEPVKRLRKLQNVLGDHQDAMVAQTHLQSYRTAQGAGKGDRKIFKDLIRGEKRLAGEHRSKFAKAWKRFEAAADGLPKALKPAG
jgi:CHAD domain-containing protein